MQRPAFVFMLLLVLMTDAVTRFFCSASGAEANGNNISLNEFFLKCYLIIIYSI